MARVAKLKSMMQPICPFHPTYRLRNCDLEWLELGLTQGSNVTLSKLNKYLECKNITESNSREKLKVVYWIVSESP